MHFDSPVMITYNGYKIETLLTVALLGKYVMDRGLRCQIAVNNDLFQQLRLDCDFAMAGPSEKAKIEITMYDEDGRNSNFELFGQNQAVIFKSAPWKNLDASRSPGLIMASCNPVFSVSNNFWKSCNTGFDIIETGTLFSAWDTLQNLLPPVVVTDDPGIVKLARLVKARVVYLGGVNPKAEWWPIYHGQDSASDLAWIQLKDADTSRRQIVKRCPCVTPRHCHAHHLEVPPCIADLSAAGNASRAKSQVNLAVQNAMKGAR